MEQGITEKVNSKPKIPFKISFTWDIHYKCNFRCTYCFFMGQWDEMAKENRHLSIEKWIDIWNDIYKRYGKCHIHFSGGEPFTYPQFLELLSGLSKIFTLEFDTNLSFEIAPFLNSIGSAKTVFNASFHPEFIDFDVFLNKVIALKNNGHIISINYVGYPPFLEFAKQCKEKCRDIANFNILPFRGTYEGKTYPVSYTQAEKEIVYISSSPHITDAMDKWYDSEKLVNAKEKESERICYMGQFYSKIRPSGDAYRCCMTHPDGRLGNLIDGTFSLWNEPRPCRYDHCSCWKSPILGEEERWEKFWWKNDE